MLPVTSSYQNPLAPRWKVDLCPGLTSRVDSVSIIDFFLYNEICTKDNPYLYMYIYVS